MTFEATTFLLLALAFAFMGALAAFCNPYASVFCTKARDIATGIVAEIMNAYYLERHTKDTHASTRDIESGEIHTAPIAFRCSYATVFYTKVRDIAAGIVAEIMNAYYLDPRVELERLTKDTHAATRDIESGEIRTAPIAFRFTKSIYRTAWNYCNNWHIFWLVINMAITSGISIYEARALVQQDYEMVTTAMIVSNIVAMAIPPLLSRHSLIAKMEFIRDAYHHFSNLNEGTKMTTNTKTWNIELYEAVTGIMLLINWGIPCIINTLSQLVGCLYVFYYSGSIASVFWVVALLVFYYTVIQRWVNTVTTSMMERSRDIRRKIEVQNDFINTGLVYGREFDELINKAINGRMESNTLGQNTDTFIEASQAGTRVFTSLITLLVLLNTSSTVLLFQNMRNMMGAVQEFSHFFTFMQRNINNYDTFYTWVVRVGMGLPPAPQYEMPADGLLFSASELAINKFRLSVGAFSLKPRDCILVRGHTGSGKTTFFRALMGHMAGLQLDCAGQTVTDSRAVSQSLQLQTVANFRDLFLYLPQTVRDAYPSGAGTFANYIAGEIDVSVFEQCVDLVNMRAFFTVGGVLEPYKQFAMPSGGEKMRICLLMVLYNFTKSRAQFLVLDEPEQGLDPENTGDILLKIIDYVRESGRGVLMVTHACDCVVGKMPFTGSLTFADGRATLVR